MSWEKEENEADERRGSLPLPRAKTVAFNALDYYSHKTGNREGQVDMCIEECSELIKALLKLRRDKHSVFRLKNVHQELADVQIMVFQMMKLHGWDESMAALEAKTRRLEERIAK